MDELRSSAIPPWRGGSRALLESCRGPPDLDQYLLFLLSNIQTVDVGLIILILIIKLSLSLDKTELESFLRVRPKVYFLYLSTDDFGYLKIRGPPSQNALRDTCTRIVLVT